MLTIKRNETDDVIELEKMINCIHIEINGKIVATFFDDGEFRFFGKGDNSRFMGKWK